MAMTKFNLVVNIEVAQHKGEDANLAEEGKENFLMGVFDGLGGRSAGYDGKTGGYIASKEASDISKRVLSQWRGKINPENAVQLQDDICQRLKYLADTHMPKTSSKLRGSLIEHKLCTTIAIASVLKQQGQDKVFEVDLAWMGDSRIYFLSPTKGLQQLTKDDLVTPKDAWEMLREDPPMSQYLTADMNPKWQIHFQHYKIEESGCFLACTDGCFQYFSAPWEFERLLLETLQESAGDKIANNNWQELISKRYAEIKQDDVSLILYSVGFNGIKNLKNSYKQRFEELQKKFIYPSGNSDYDRLHNLWSEYRIDYESYFKCFEQYKLVQSSQAERLQNESSISEDSSTPDWFKKLSELSKNKAAAKAEEIQKYLEYAWDDYSKNDFEKAEKWCQKALSINAYHSECQYILGLIDTNLALRQSDAFHKREIFKQAATKLESAVEWAGSKLNTLSYCIELYKTLGYLYYQLSQGEKSVNYYQKCFQEYIFDNSQPISIKDWADHLEAFYRSVKLIESDSQYKAIQQCIVFCRNFIVFVPYISHAHFYYVIAILEEIRGDLNAAWQNIQRASDIYDSSFSHPEVDYEQIQKVKQKAQEIQNKSRFRRNY